MKRHFQFILTGLAITCQLALSQPGPPPAGNKADSLRSAGDLKGAIAEYKKMLVANPADQRALYNCACAFSLDRQIDSCFRYLDKRLAANPPISALTDPDFLNAREDQRWKSFENKLVESLTKAGKLSVRDPDYAASLWRLMAIDQAYMYEIGIAVRKLGFDSPVVSAMQKLKSVLQERNVRELEALIAKKGWPKMSDVGPEAAGAAFYVVQHSNAVIQEKYLPLLKSRCDEKEASSVHYAMLYDRLKMNQNLPQRYGTQANLDNRATGTFELYPLEDKLKVNEWRKEVGLPPLKMNIE